MAFLFIDLFQGVRVTEAQLQHAKRSVFWMNLSFVPLHFSGAAAMRLKKGLKNEKWKH